MVLSIADPSGRAVGGVGLRPLACCDRGFESHRGHGCLSVVCVCVCLSVVCVCVCVCILSGTVLCDELITRPEHSCRLRRIVVCDQETS
jgi:hypothetical protein